MGGNIQIATLESPHLDTAQRRCAEFDQVFPADQIINALRAFVEEARTVPLAKRFSPDKPPFSTYPAIHPQSVTMREGIESEAEMKRWQLAHDFEAIVQEILRLSQKTKNTILDLEAAKYDF